jgi:protein-L-isoaspartate(D-aspartate) O-methyltransferase
MNILGQENVLEIGTGSGYFTALLSHFVKKIISVDVFSDLIHEAENKVQKFKACDIDFICQNAEYGLAEKAPFDAIIITCGMNNLSSQIKSQLKASGKIFYICGNSESMSGKIVTLDKTKNWQENFIFDTKVPMLITEKPEDSFVF